MKWITMKKKEKFSVFRQCPQEKLIFFQVYHKLSFAMFSLENSNDKQQGFERNDCDMAQLLFSNGSFSKSLICFEKSMEGFKKTRDFHSYLFCYIYVIQILNELQDTERLRHYNKELERLSQEHDFSEKPLVIAYSSYYSLYIDKDFVKVKTDMRKALKIAFDQYDEAVKSGSILDQNNLRFEIMFCLYIYSIYYYEIKEYSLCLKELDNLDILLKDYLDIKNELDGAAARQESPPENQAYYIRALNGLNKNLPKIQMMKIGIKLIKALIQIRHFKKYSQADKTLWSLYEEVNTQNMKYLAPYILFYMSWCQFLSGNKSQTALFYNLAEKSANPERKLFLNYLEKFKTQASLEPISYESSHYDIIFNTRDNKLIERKKGFVDLKSQFILIDLLKILLLNQGVSYSKEKLVEKIWKEDYSPEVHDNKIYVTIKRLREAIEVDSCRPVYICRNSVGYYFSKSAKILIKQEI